LFANGLGVDPADGSCGAPVRLGGALEYVAPGGVEEALDHGQTFGHFEPLELQPTSPTQHTRETTNRAKDARMADAPFSNPRRSRQATSRLRVARMCRAVSG
jgi:hypothetical protein